MLPQEVESLPLQVGAGELVIEGVDLKEEDLSPIPVKDRLVDIY
jgi:hypothetical protein